MSTAIDRKYASFADFYPDYLNEHSNPTCRKLHFVGSTLALLCIAALFVTANTWWLAVALISGYGFAWIGHFVFEKNRPATFRHPFYSFLGDWAMYWELLTGKRSFR